MTAGDLIQSTVGDNDVGTSHSLTFGSNCTAGSLLVCTASSDTPSDDLAMITAGWSEDLNHFINPSRSIAGGIWHKQAAGGAEGAIQVGSSNATICMSLYEFEWYPGKLISLNAFSPASLPTSDTTTPITTGTAVATTIADAVVIALIAAEFNGALITGITWASSFTARHAHHGVPGSQTAGLVTASRVLTATNASLSSAMAWTGGGPVTIAWGGLAAFSPVDPPSIVKTDIGNAVGVPTADGSQAITTTAAVNPGEAIIVRVALDNAQSAPAGGIHTSVSVTDSNSNVYTLRPVLASSALADPGVANAGVVGYLFTAAPGSTLASGSTITVSWSPNTAARAIQVEKWTGLKTSALLVSFAALTGTTPGTTPAGAATPTANNQLVYVHYVSEGIAADTFNLDADTTAGVWQQLTARASANATATNNVATRGQYKIPNATTAQSWASTTTSRDWAGIIYVFDLADTSTPKTDGDTGTGTEDAEVITVAITNDDPGTAVEAATIATTLTSDEPATGTETELITVQISDGDAGTAVETESIQAITAISDGDTGTAVETESLAVTLVSDEPATAVETEAITNTTQIASTDTATATESEAIAVTLSDAETGTAVETESVSSSTQKADTDTGTAVETEAVTVNISDGDTATAIETEALTNVTQITDNDSGVAVESATVSSDSTVVADDIGTATESELITVQISDGDTATAVETESVTTGEATTAKSDTDAGTAVETETVVVNISDGDTGLAVEAESLVAQVSNGDVGTAVDAAESIGLTANDTGTATETETITVQISDGDVGVAVEAATISNTLSNGDTGVAAEAEAILASLSAADSGSAVDSQSVVINLINEIFNNVIGLDGAELAEVVVDIIMLTDTARTATLVTESGRWAISITQGYYRIEERTDPANVYYVQVPPGFGSRWAGNILYTP